MGLRGPIAIASETITNVPEIGNLTLLEKSAARFVRVLTQLMKRKRILTSPEFKSQERRPRGQSTTTTSSYGATDDTLNVADATIFSVGDLCVAPRVHDQSRVLAVNSATQILVKRALGTSGQSYNSGEELLRVARVENEGYTVGPGYVTDTVHVINYIATVSTPVKWTNYQMKQASYLSDSQKQSRMKEDERAMGIEHLRELNRLLLYSYKSKTTANNLTLYTPNGFIPSIVSKVYDHNGGVPITETQWNRNIMEPAWSSNEADEKWGFISNKILSDVSAFGLDKYRTMDNESQQMGFSVTGYLTSRGSVKFVHEPSLDATNYYNESIALADFNWLQLAFWEDTEYKKAQQRPDQRQMLNEWATGVGLDMTYEECHVFARDLRTAA